MWWMWCQDAAGKGKLSLWEIVYLFRWNKKWLRCMYKLPHVLWHYFQGLKYIFLLSKKCVLPHVIFGQLCFTECVKTSAFMDLWHTLSGLKYIFLLNKTCVLSFTLIFGQACFNVVNLRSLTCDIILASFHKVIHVSHCTWTLIVDYISFSYLTTLRKPVHLQ